MGTAFDLTLDIVPPVVACGPCAGSANPDVGVVMATALGEMEVVIEAMRLGAYSYVVKPFKLELVAHEVARAMERQRLGAENRAYQRELEQKVAGRGWCGLRPAGQRVKAGRPGPACVLPVGRATAEHQIILRVLHQVLG